MELSTVKAIEERYGSSDPTVSESQTLLGSLLAVARCTRQGISFTVHRAAPHSHKSAMSDWKYSKRIARYLKFTEEIKLRTAVNVTECCHIKLESWSDVDFSVEGATKIL